MRQRYNRDGLVDYTNVRRTNATWTDHIFRTNVTAGLIASLAPQSVMDPACGDGSIVLAAAKLVVIPQLYLGEISRPDIDALQGIPDVHTNLGTISQSFAAFPRVNVVVLTETLEHLPDPDAVVTAAREKADFLVASSPLVGADEVDDNMEHLWGFDEQGYAEMLEQGGWTPVIRNVLMFRDFPYTFQIWVAR